MTPALIPVNIPRSLAAISAAAPALFVPNARAAERFFEFFTAKIRNKNTRRAYYKAACCFSEWCEGRGLRDLASVRPLHVAAYIELLELEKPKGKGFSKPTVKQHLAALRMLFDWLVVGHVLDVNPAHAVRGPKYVVKKGKTPVLDRDEARSLLDHIRIVRKVRQDDGTIKEEPDLVGMRDRALISVMIYTFARVGACCR